MNHPTGPIDITLSSTEDDTNREEVKNMPAAVQAGRVVACHGCANKEVPVTTTGLLRRHTNARGNVCRKSNQPKENRVKVRR